jgi:hypothetical protein
MHQLKKPLVVILTLALAACSANGSDPKGVTTANVSANVLQLQVGTANLQGVVTGLNVVATYRQPASGGFKPGDSGTLLNSPKLTVPGQLPGTPGAVAPYDPTSTILGGPASAELNGHVMGPTSQVPNSTNETTFGLSGGVFGLGIEPYNAYGSYDAPSGINIGAPFQVAPYPVPLYDFAGDADAFVPWGGPPAFNIAGNGQSVVGSGAYPAGTRGAELGIDVFATVPPALGAYQLSVIIPANTGRFTQTATANMGAVTLLPTVGPPGVSGYGSGNATLNVALPGKVTEAYLQVTDIGPQSATSTSGQPASCNGSGGGNPIYYTIHVAHSGSFLLGSARGPGGAPTICTAADNTAADGAPVSGDQFTVQTIGFDYPAFESSYPSSLGNPAPNIVGVNGTDDITISKTAVCVEPVPPGVFACAAPFTSPRGGTVRRNSSSIHHPSATTRKAVINL